MCKNLLIWTEDARVMIDVTGVGGAVKMTVFSSRSGLWEKFEQPKCITLSLFYKLHSISLVIPTVSLFSSHPIGRYDRGH